MLRLALRTLPLFAIIVSFAVALGAYMNFSGVRGAYTELIRSRLQMVAEEVEHDILSATALAIPLSEQTTLPALLARQAAADPAILSIDVESPEGSTLFSSVPARVGAPHRPDGQSFDVTKPVLNDFGAVIGRVVVRYDRTGMREGIGSLAAGIAGDAVPAGLMAMLAGSLAAFLIMTRLHGRARRLSEPGAPDAVTRAGDALAAIEQRS
ncbi:hypothetical protein [Rhodoligotrophos defluvii]|uniref:hypothetical protein n=1 Tax=Rhodoligotrophos defluvii TaxID=2561934 RepID=UPI0010C98804|nr:hypothetical protein [Rhodoligotrophos defluvii]